jgi:hypothetical protein
MSVAECDLPLKERVRRSYLDFKDERGVKRSSKLDKVILNYYQWLTQWFPYLALDIDKDNANTGENNLREWLGELHPAAKRHKHKHKRSRSNRSESPLPRSKKSKK